MRRVLGRVWGWWQCRRGRHLMQTVSFARERAGWFAGETTACQRGCGHLEVRSLPNRRARRATVRELRRRSTG